MIQKIYLHLWQLVSYSANGSITTQKQWETNASHCVLRYLTGVFISSFENVTDLISLINVEPKSNVPPSI
jgi:hypothetical protein